MKVRMFTLLVIASFMMYTSCGGDDKESTSNFDSQTQANQQAQANATYINGSIDYVESTIDLASDSWTAVLGKVTNASGTWTYNTSTFWWERTGSGNVFGQNGTEIEKVRFTARGANGEPISTTNKMEYIYDGEVTNDVYDILVDVNVTTNGVADYRNHTGPLTLNGDNSFTIQFEQQNFKYIYSVEYNNIVMDWDEEYPQSGFIEFTLKFDYDIQGVKDYTVKGKITFNGNNTATFEFGGYNFTINLVTGTIS